MSEGTNNQGSSATTATTGFSKTSTVFIRRPQSEPVYKKPELTEAERAMLQRLVKKQDIGDAGDATWE